MSSICRPTRTALIFLNILSEPLSAIYTLLPFIFIKDLHTTPLQLALFISIRPILSFFSFYWGSFFNKNTANLLKNVQLACIFAHLPFLLFAFSNNVWFLLISAAFFQLFHRAGTPAWLEIVHRKLPKNIREKSFSYSFAAGFIVSGLFGIFLGVMLDSNPNFFKILLFLASSMGLCSLLFLRSIPPIETEEKPAVQKGALKESFKLLYQRKDFRHFQWIFMVGGATLMLMAPSLSVYYVENLSLSHLKISFARFVFMALGVIPSTIFWNRIFQVNHINRLIGPILIGFSLFPVFLLLTQWNLWLLYFAFFIYGIAQAGSHLAWNLSGITFSKGKNSLLFSQVNLLMIGIRGLIFPFLGSFLCQLWGAPTILILGTFLCLAGATFAMVKAKSYKEVLAPRA